MMALSTLLSPGDDIKPKISQVQLPALVQDQYHLSVKSITQLDGYDDKNYFVQVLPETTNPYISSVWEHGYTLKIMNSLDSENTEFVTAQHQLLWHLDKWRISVPLPVKNIKGDEFFILKCGSEKGNLVRLLTYQPGTTLNNFEPTPELHYNVGRFTGKLSNCLKDFKNFANKERKSIWMLECVLSIRQFLHAVKDEYKLLLVTNVLQQFEDKVMRNLYKLERGTIHGDLNEHNILILNEDVEAVLDFGDSHYSALVFELAICMCYIFIHSNGIEGGKDIVRGYIVNRQLDPMEKEVLRISICARLCQSLVLGLYSYSQDPCNNYILGTQKNGWMILERLHQIEDSQIFEYWGLK